MRGDFGHVSAEEPHPRDQHDPPRSDDDATLSFLRIAVPIVGHDATLSRAWREAVGALVKGADAVSRRLLSEELDGNPPFLDPRTPLTERWLIQTAGRLGFPTSKVRAKLETLAEPFMLRLAWDRGE